jgi:phosphoribosylformylglycinamidine synthase
MELWVVGPRVSGSLAGSAIQRLLGEANGGAPTPPDPEAGLRVVELAAQIAHQAPVLHDISDGGLAIAATEIAIASGVGLVIETEHPFCEDPHRFLIAARPGSMDLPDDLAQKVGMFGGNEITINGSAITVAEATDLYRNALPRRMA